MVTLSRPLERRSVLVTDAGSAQGLTVVRSLGRAGWRVIATQPIRSERLGRQIRLRSRWAERTVGVPDPEFDGRAAGDALGDLARTEGVDLVFPVTDKSILALLAYGRLDDSVLALPERSSLEVAWSKASTIDLATSLDIATPRSVTVTSPGDAAAAAAQLGWPVVIKPERSHGWAPDGSISTRAVSIAANSIALRRSLSADAVFPLLIQEYLPGYGTGVELLARGGTTVAAFQHRRIHEVPLDGGMSALRRAERPEPELLDQSARLLAGLDWTGLAMVEFRMTPKGPVLMEINGRVWGSMALPVRAGVDFPLLAAELHSGLPLTGTMEIDERVTCVNLELELRWMIAALRSRFGPNRPHDIPVGEVARSAARLLDPRTNFDVQATDDLRPSIADAVAAVHRVGRDGVTAITGRLANPRR